MVHPSCLYTFNPGSVEPIYQQLIAQTNRHIAAGNLRAGDRLPSVRKVASAHGINPMTVSKAYGLMVAQGLLTRRAGAGMVVSAEATVARAAVLAPHLQRAVCEGRGLGLTFEEVIEQFYACWRVGADASDSGSGNGGRL